MEVAAGSERRMTARLQHPLASSEGRRRHNCRLLLDAILGKSEVRLPLSSPITDMVGHERRLLGRGLVWQWKWWGKSARLRGCLERSAGACVLLIGDAHAWPCDAGASGLVVVLLSTHGGKGRRRVRWLGWRVAERWHRRGRRHHDVGTARASPTTNARAQRKALHERRRQRPMHDANRRDERVPWRKQATLTQRDAGCSSSARKGAAARTVGTKRGPSTRAQKAS